MAVRIATGKEGNETRWEKMILGGESSQERACLLVPGNAAPISRIETAQRRDASGIPIYLN